MTSPRLGRHAVVIGGSMAGLLAARVLADHFDAVTLVERDVLEGVEARKGVPQGRHAHALLARGQQIIEKLFPGITAELTEAGAISVDLMADARWYQPGGYRQRTASGLRGVIMTRPLIEAQIRRRVFALPNLTAMTEADVTDIIADSNRRRITDIQVWRRTSDGGPAETLNTDLVVDAGGRGSRAPAWLEKLGYQRPQEEQIKIGVGYATRTFERRPGDLSGAAFVFVQPTPPHETRVGVLIPIEGNRWICTLGGWLGDHSPTDLDGFLAFARSLPVSDIYDTLKSARPLDDGEVYKFPANLRRRYERLQRVPEGYMVIRDALCSFNPIYGQGMTVSAQEARELAVCLRNAQTGLSELPRTFYQRAAKVIDVPWLMAASADFAYPAVTGQKARSTNLLNWYLDHVQRAATVDPQVCRCLVEVTNLLAQPSKLMAPQVVARVARARLRH